MKHLHLFENFDGSDDAKMAAEGQLEDLIVKAFPNHEYNPTADASAGYYTLDADSDGDGTKYVFANVYFEDAEFKKLNQDLDDYDEFVKNLEKHGEVEIYNIGTSPEVNMIGIMVAYGPSNFR